MARDPIALVEAAYRLDLLEEGWLRALVDAAPWLDGGLGLMAYTYEIDGPSVALGPFVTKDGTTAMDSAAREIHAAPSWDGVVRAYLTPCFASMRDVMAGSGDSKLVHTIERSLPSGVVDVLGLVAHDPSGQGLVLAGPRPALVHVPKREIPHARRLAAHLAAALLLRRALSEGRGSVDAVLTPRGRVLHATEPSKDARSLEALSEATRARDTARGAARRRDAEGALDAWRARVDGRWSLVDADERDGKALVLAHANALSVPEPSGLAPRERQVAICAALGWSNELVAYTLGLSESSVASSLAAARQKLGVRSRVELVASLASLATMPARPKTTLHRDLDALTPAERDVLTLVVQGASNADIARARTRSERTVANQVAAVLRKTGAGSRAELAARLLCDSP